METTVGLTALRAAGTDPWDIARALTSARYTVAEWLNPTRGTGLGLALAFSRIPVGERSVLELAHADGGYVHMVVARLAEDAWHVTYRDPSEEDGGLEESIREAVDNVRDWRAQADAYAAAELEHVAHGVRVDAHRELGRAVGLLLWRRGTGRMSDSAEMTRDLADVTDGVACLDDVLARWGQA